MVSQEPIRVPLTNATRVVGEVICSLAWDGPHPVQLTNKQIIKLKTTLLSWGYSNDEAETIMCAARGMKWSQS